MPQRLREYFNSVADTIASKAITAGVNSENSDIGTNREIVAQGFLQKHIPKRFAINLGGDIFGLPNARSGQIDIIINHDMSMTFLENFKIQCPVESVTAAISIKSNLTKGELFNALSNLATIPQASPSVVALNPFKKSVESYLLSWPSLFIFAYDGMSLETCMGHLSTFYSTHTVAFNRIPRAIVVNKQYLIFFPHYEYPNPPATSPVDFSFIKASKVTNETRGYPLFWLMAEVSKGLSWLDGLYLNYAGYFEAAFRT